MSDYENYKGKIRKVEFLENETFAEASKRLFLKEEPGYDLENYYDTLLYEEYYDKYIKVKNMYIFEIFDHIEKDYEDSYIEFNDNHDGTYSFTSRFYNGGTCLSEMIEYELEDKIITIK